MNSLENYELLTKIVSNFQWNSIPLEFSLKHFLGWSDETVKKFLKERKKALKATAKQAALERDVCCGTSKKCGGCDA